MAYHDATAPSALHDTRTLMLRPVRSTLRTLRTVGECALFIVLTLGLLPVTLRRYHRQTLQAMNSLAWGRGSVIVDGGTVSVLVILGVALGASLAIEAFATLNLIGFGALSGIVAGVGAVREIGPLVAGIAYTVTAGCRMTAEIGSMRIADEIDAVEAMGLRPIPFVVGTRLIGGLAVVVPGYLLTMVTSFWVMDTVIRVFHHQPGGTYNHYFLEFLTPTDLLYSLIKAMVFCVAVTLIHCYYGYFVTGGPVGVGRASGRAVRASLVTIFSLDFVLTVLLWGLHLEFSFKG